MELENQEIILRFPADARDICVSKAAKPAVHPNQSLIHCATTVLTRGLRDGGMNLTFHFHHVPKFRTLGATRPLPHTPSWHAQRHLYL